MEMSFMPDFDKASELKAYPWMYTPILPLVFGAELSYMEQVAKLHHKVNELIQNDSTVNKNFAALVEAFGKWEEFLNTSNVPDGGVTTIKLADSAVTSAKIADGAVETKHIAKGAVTSLELGEHAVEGHNLAVGAVDRHSKISSGVIVSEHFSEGAVDNAAIGEGSVTGGKLADCAVTSAKIADGAVETKHIAKGAVTSLELGEHAVEGHNLAVGAVDRHSKISSGVIVSEHFSEGAVDNAAIGEGSVTGGKLATAVVTTSKIAEKAVTNDKLADGAVTADKLSSDVTLSTFSLKGYDIPVLAITGDMAGISKENYVTLGYNYGEHNGSCQMKHQGATSVQIANALGEHGKYNFTIVFDNEFEVANGWGSHSKYCLKADFIDPTHLRNVGSCKRWGKMVKSRTGAPSELTSLPNGGAIDGFPCVITLNGKFYGLYNWNIPKDGWMFGLSKDSSKTQAIVGANDHSTATQFKGELAGDESDFEVEFVSDKNNTAWVTTSLNRLINACLASDGADIDTVVGRYIDIPSVIDYLISVVVDKGTDCVDKNFLLVTFDGVKWYMSAYDRDSIFGLNWDGSGLSRPVSNVSFSECAATSRLFELIVKYKTTELKTRYNELRGGILSESRINQVHDDMGWKIPEAVRQEDFKRWKRIPGTSVNNISQLRNFIAQRLPVVDKWCAALVATNPGGDSEPEEVVNLVPLSTDTDGSIFNGTGYKDNYRLSSSGGVSSSQQSGSTVTGFMPFDINKPLYLKGGTFERVAGKHYYFNVYDSNKSYLYGISADGYANESYTGSSIESAGGITTFDFTGGSNSAEWFAKFKSASFFRINVEGKGAELSISTKKPE